MLSEATYPVLLMPIKLETRFVKIKYREVGIIKEDYELWLRIFPDTIFLNSFDPNLSVEESRDKEEFSPLILRGDSEVEKKNAWRVLVSKYGVYRASWILHCEDEYKNRQGDDGLTFSFKWLPDYFRVYVYHDDPSKPSPIVQDLSNLGGFRDGIHLLEKNDWLTVFDSDDDDIDTAVKIGLATKIEITEEFTKCSRIIAVGLRKEATEPSAEMVKDLLKSHQYTNGFSFLDYGTPTNNIDDTKSGYSSSEEFDATASFDYSTQPDQSVAPLPLTVTSSREEDVSKLEELLQAIPAKYKVEDQTHAQAITAGIGFSPSAFQHIKHARKVESRLNHLVKRSTWFAMGGQILGFLLGDNFDNDAHDKIWEFYSKYVHNRGPYPAIKIADLPYGILPVTHIRSILSEREVHDTGSPEQQTDYILAKLFESWFEMSQTTAVPRLPNAREPEEEMANIISMEPVSSFLQIRLMELERMKNILTDRFENPAVFPVPQSMFSYPPKLVDELISEDNAYQRDLGHAKEAFDEIKHERKLGDFLDQEHLMRYSPLLTFKDAGTANISDLAIEVVPKSPDEQDWYKTDFLQLVMDRLQGVERFGYPGKTDFLLIDLLNESYHNARTRYNRIIKFYPSKEDVQDVQAHNIRLNSAEINALVDREVMAGEEVFRLYKTYGNGAVDNEGIVITAPFSGIITKVYLQAGEPLKDDRQLFKILNQEKHNEVTMQMAALQAQIILEIERIRASGEDFIKAQEQAVMEALDLNSFRLDAWLTGAAQRRIDQLRTVSDGAQKEGVYFGAYGWVENLEQSGEPALIDKTNDDDALQNFKDENVAEGGIIHAPSSAQVVTSAMFRQSFATYKGLSDIEKVNPYTLNLTSDRIQHGQQLMDGLRQNQELEALLGYKLERFLHENKQDILIHDLRKKYPLTVNKIEDNRGREKGLPQLTVINALNLAEQYEGDNSYIREGIDLVENILDGSADVLLYEAGYQLLQGNYSQAAAAADAAKGILEPPETQALKTRIPGVGQTHKLVLLLPEPPIPSTYEAAKNPKAFIEPSLELWLKNLLGQLSRINCPVVVSEIIESNQLNKLDDTNVSLDQLQIGYLDLLHMTVGPIENEATELEQRIMEIARKQIDQKREERNSTRTQGNPVIEEIDWGRNDIQFEILEDQTDTGLNIHDAIEILSYVRSFLKEARTLKEEDVISEVAAQSEDAIHDLTILDDLHRKLLACLEQLENPETDLRLLAKYDVQNAKGVFGYTTTSTTPELIQRCRIEAQQKVQAARTEMNKWGYGEGKNYLGRVLILESVAQILFGSSFQLVIPFAKPESFKTALTMDQRLLIGDESLQFQNGTSGGQERIRHWLDGRAAVSPQAEAFADLLMVTGLKDKQEGEFRIAQYTEGGIFPWIALDGEEIEKVTAQQVFPIAELVPLREGQLYPEDGASIVVYDDSTKQPEPENEGVYGLFIDQFSEIIPDQKVNTGVAFQYDAPNNEAPQALLLAAPSDEVMSKERWNEEFLRDIVYDTIDLTKVRMVDADAMQKYGYALPMTFWFNIPNTI